MSRKTTKVAGGDTGRIEQYNDLRTEARKSSQFTPFQQVVPDLTLYVNEGKVFFDATLKEFAGGNSPSFTAPVTNPRIDLLTLISAGTLKRTAGAESASPSAPAIPIDEYPICYVYNRVGQTSIKEEDDSSNGYIWKDLRAEISKPNDVASKTDLDTHKALQTEGVHGSTVAATANKLIHRDASGRAKIANPSADTDITNKGSAQGQVDTHAAIQTAGVHGSASAATVNKLIHRDSSGRAKVAAPSASDDIARKNEIDVHAALTNPHSATDAATASRIVLRDASSRAKMAAPSADTDIANKKYVDDKTPNIQIFTTSGTWTKPTGARLVIVEVIGGGGGGGNGSKVDASRSGGSGGGGGAINRAIFRADDLSATVAITRGAGGGAGVAGGMSSFGEYIKAYGGGRGSALSSIGEKAGGAGGGTGSVGGDGGESASTGGDPLGTTGDANAGGGAGGRVADGGCSENGGAGGGGVKGGSSINATGGGGGGGRNKTSSPAYDGEEGGKGGGSYVPGGGGAGGIADGGNGTAGAAGITGSGGGGGGGAFNTPGGNGGAGGIPGGGGGGGGSTRTGTSAGAGGAGGRGEVRVYTHF